MVRVCPHTLLSLLNNQIPTDDWSHSYAVHTQSEWSNRQDQSWEMAPKRVCKNWIWRHTVCESCCIYDHMPSSRAAHTIKPQHTANMGSNWSQRVHMIGSPTIADLMMRPDSIQIAIGPSMKIHITAANSPQHRWANRNSMSILNSGVVQGTKILCANFLDLRNTRSRSLFVAQNG